MLIFFKASIPLLEGLDPRTQGVNGKDSDDISRDLNYWWHIATH